MQWDVHIPSYYLWACVLAVLPGQLSANGYPGKQQVYGSKDSDPCLPWEAQIECMDSAFDLAQPLLSSL